MCLSESTGSAVRRAPADVPPPAERLGELRQLDRGRGERHVVPGLADVANISLAYPAVVSLWGRWSRGAWGCTTKWRTHLHDATTGIKGVKGVKGASPVRKRGTHLKGVKGAGVMQPFPSRSCARP